MKRAIRREDRGSTLVELIVAVVLLAIVVMFVAMVPVQSQKMMLNADRVSAASAAARDKMENFRHVIGRTSGTYRGFTVLQTLYSPGVWYRDTFKLQEIQVLRQWQFQYPAGINGDSAKASIDLRCCYLYNGKLPQDSLNAQVRVNTWVAKRDTLPPL